MPSSSTSYRSSDSKPKVSRLSLYQAAFTPSLPLGIVPAPSSSSVTSWSGSLVLASCRWQRTSSAALPSRFVTMVKYFVFELFVKSVC